MNNTVKPNPYAPFLMLLVTKHEAREAVASLEEVLNSLFLINETLDYSLTKHLPVPLAKTLKQYLAEKKLLSQPKEFLKDPLEKIIEYIRGLQSISLTLGFSPSEAVLRTIAQWVKENLGREILLDYTVDRHIVGGAIIVYGGVYRDVSLNQLLSDSFTKNKQQIEAIFS